MRRPVLALLCWLAVIVPLSIAGIGIDGRLQSLAMTMEQSPSGKVIVRETQAFGPRNLAVIALAGPRGQLPGTRDRLAQRLRRDDVVLVGPLMTGRGGAWMLVAQMRGSDSTLTRTTMPAVRRTVAATVEPPVRAYITGYVDAGSVLIERSVKDIRRFERYLHRNGTIVRKFFLNVSREEQHRRFLERLDRPEKNWKFSAADVLERAHWDAYMEAYQDAIASTASREAPWYVVPADNKWFTRAVVAAAIVDALASLDLAYPTVTPQARNELAVARQQLLREG